MLVAIYFLSFPHYNIFIVLIKAVTMMFYEIVETHVSDIKCGDCIMERGILVTVSKNQIKRDPFMGITIRGDSYHLGRKPVMKAVIKTMLPDGSLINASDFKAGYERYKASLAGGTKK